MKDTRKVKAELKKFIGWKKLPFRQPIINYCCTSYGNTITVEFKDKKKGYITYNTACAGYNWSITVIY